MRLDSDHPDITPLPTEQVIPLRQHYRFARAMGAVLLAIGVMCVGAAYCVSIYSLFNTKVFTNGTGTSGLMLTSFLVGLPLVAGILVTWLAGRSRKAGLAKSGMLTMLALALFVFAAGALLREGMICILMAAPLFVVLGLIGVVIGMVTASMKPARRNKLMSMVAVMPLAMGAAESTRIAPVETQHMEQSVYIDAPPATVWHHVNYPTNIQPSELKDGIAYKMGVPYPIEARTIEPKVGGLRELTWQRNVTFQEEITDWEDNRYIAWKYKFTAQSFPDGSLDDHIVIGGRYFNLLNTGYRLAPEGRGTRLTLLVTNTVSTNFNWYAGAWSRFLINDTGHALLQFYKHRSEAT